MRRNAITLFASALLLTWAHRAAAQSPCEDALRDAEKSYELGLFEDVPTKASYSLTYTGGDGATITIVQAAAFDSLKEESMEAPAAEEPE